MMGIKGKIANWNRFQTIVRVLAKHGFSSFIHELGIPTPGFKLKKLEGESIPRRLRAAFEELGPSFIKLGQLLSTRSDLFPESYIEEFSKLTDQIPNFEFEEVQRILEHEFGRKPNEIYQTIEPEPLAAASIAQVHIAQLKESGEEVVIKVQRPNIRKTIENDIQVLYFIAKTLESFREDFKVLNLTGIVQEFQRTINEELDFTREARNIDSFHEHFDELEGIRIPDVYWNCCTKKVLTMSRLKGTPLSQVVVFPDNVDRKFLAESVVTFYLESIFFHGLFHADAHVGNFVLNSEGRGEIGVLDFGMVGSLTPQLKRKLSKMFLSLISQDYEALSVIYGDIGVFTKRFAFNEFQSDVKDFVAPNLDRPLSELNVGQMLLDSTRIARKHQLRLPKDLMTFFRTIVTVEAIGRKLDPDFQFFTYGKKFAKALLKRRFALDEIGRDIFKTIEGFRTLGVELPTQVKLLLRRLEQEDFGAESTQKLIQNFSRSNRRTTVGFATMSFMISAVILTALRPEHYFIWPLWIIGFMFTAYLMKLVVRP